MIAVLRVSYFTLHWNDDKQLTKSSLGAKFSEFFVLFGTQLKALCISENFSFYTLRSSVCMAVMIINAMVPSHVLLSAPKRYPSGQANKVMKNNLYIYMYERNSIKLIMVMMVMQRMMMMMMMMMTTVIMMMMMMKKEQESKRIIQWYICGDTQWYSNN